MPPTFFSKNVDLKLIQLVKENPVLYNPRHPKYTDSDTREVTWQKIGDALSRPAAEFAGIQCQIHYGDFQEDKHKPGFIENMKEFMPEQYASSWGIEKKVLKEYSKHQGLSTLEAKNLYTKTARSLPTYGVTFFLVKEKQKDKKKLIPRLLGISAEAVLRLDERTKEVIEEWPLTHIKTYHAAKGEIFTLDFGDYSNEQYSVKTRDACRIRDILEDYIDLIRKRMMAPYNSSSTETSYVTQDNISSSQVNVVQHVTNNPMKLVEQSFVGPSKIVTHEVGKNAMQGTQIITVQQIVVSDKVHQHQQGVKGEVGMRGDMSLPFTRRLNRLNSNSVKIVSLLTVPSQTHVEDARKIVEAMNADLSYVRDGVHDTIDKQTSEEEKKKLQDQMNELDELMKLLNEYSAPGYTEEASELGDAAMKVADLTTQMYFSLDSRTKRRSKIISKSRPSFVEDDNTRKSLRKASFIAAASTAVHAVDGSKALLGEEYEGPVLDPMRVAELEASAVDTLGRLNAAVAHYILAHSDPKNVDYEAAVNSMNTIHELMPDFCKDAQALASNKDPQAKKQILLDAMSLCDAIKKICSSTGMDDREKLHQASDDYAEASGRLVFTFGKGLNSQKENEMLDLADDVASKTSLLLMSAQQLAAREGDTPEGGAVDAAGVGAAEAAKDVISQVKLCAPTIVEPHCQSAVTAAAEALSARVQALAASCRPVAEREGHEAGERLHHQTMDLARALDRLKGAYSALGEEEGDVFEKPNAAQERGRLRFINTVTANKKRWAELEDMIQQATPPDVQDTEAGEARSRLAQRLGQLNAALAALLAATADRDQPDYATAELAINTINELMPQVVQETKVASAKMQPDARESMMQHIKALCDASKGICANLEDTSPEERNAAIVKFTNASGKLVFGISHRGNPEKENQILELAEEAVQQTSQLLSGVQQLSEGVGGARGGELDARGGSCSDAARALLTTAQLTAQSISEPRCQSALVSSVDKLSSSSQALAHTWQPLHEDSMHRKQAQGLDLMKGQLEDKLEKIRAACLAEDVQTATLPREQQKLQFTKTMSGAKHQIDKAQEALDKPIPAPLPSDKAEAVKLRLSGRLGELNAAIAALLAATADRENPDYKTAEEAMKTITELMPTVVQDTQVASASMEPDARATMMQHIRALCDASKRLCAHSEDATPEERNAAIVKFTNASGKLVFGISHRGNPEKENQILELAEEAVQQTSQLLLGVQQLSEAVGGARGGELDARGGSCSDAARALLTTAQLTAQSISEPRCQSALVSSVDKLSSSSQALAHTWQPLHEDSMHRKQAQGLDLMKGQLEDKLEKIRAACLAEDVQTATLPREQQKLQFIKTMTGAKHQIDKAQKALDKPIPPAQSVDKAEAIQQRLSGRLGELNAALAALLTAAGREEPDYRAAGDAINTVSELLPYVVQDTQSTSANKDAATRAAMLDLIREMCEASRALCAQADGNDAKELGEAANKFSTAAGKMVYIVNPRANANRDNQIMGLTAGACSKASQLLSGVQALVEGEGVGGARGEELDRRGADVADAARGLMATAQITSPSISEPHCKKALLSSTSKLSSSGQELAQSWAPLLHDPRHHKQVDALQGALNLMEEQLDALKKACQIPDYDLKKPRLSMPFEERKLQFGVTLSGAKEQILKAQRTLDKPLPAPLAADKANAVQLRLSGRLGELNAAIAALLAATSDKEKADYTAAEQAVRTITDLIPYVVQDTHLTCANKDEATRAAMLDLIRELCEASRAVCAHADGTNTQGLGDAVSKFSDASGKLVYVVNPRVNADREKQIDDLAAAVCGQASQLLAGVQGLVGGEGGVGGARGEELDRRGADVADAAQNLLATSQVTSSSISEPHCKKALLSSTSKLSSSGQELAQSWAPLLHEPRHHKQVDALQGALNLMEEHLQELRNACDIPDGVPQSAELPAELQKLQFVKRKSVARDQIQKAQLALNKPIPAPLPSDKAEAVKLRLSGRLGELNAAIAALLAATADRENVDYKTADKAMQTITELMPSVVQDTQSSCSNTNEAERAAMLERLRELCEASRALCAGADGTNPQGMREAVGKLSDASAKLVYVVNPRANSDRERRIKSLSAGACQQASRLLGTVEKLPPTVEGRTGAELEARGGAVGAAAQLLAGTTELTAPCISEPHCKQAMQASVQKLSSSAQDLVGAWKPLLQGYTWSTLKKPLQELETQLEELTAACQIPDAELQSTKDVSLEQEKLQFGVSLSAATDQIDRSQRALGKPPPPPLSCARAVHVQRRLAGRLAELNAAVADLMLATRDRERPDYKQAEQAAKTISEIMPYVVQDSQSTCSNKDEAGRAAMLDLLRELCEASRAVCAGAGGNNTQGLSDAVSKFSDASSKLVYVVNPHASEKREKQIVSLSAEACSKASQLLGGVQALAEGEGGVRGEELDRRGAALADAAQDLLATTKITAPSISEPHCRATLLSSISKLSSSGQDLGRSWAPLLLEPRHQAAVQALQGPLQQLDVHLDKLKKACDVPDADVKINKDALEEQQKLQFVKSMSQAKEKIDVAQKSLDKPIPPPLTSDKAEIVHQRLSGRLGELNAAIASLLSATADREKPYYETAEKAVKTIVDLLPHVIEDTQSACANKDPASRASMLSLVRQLTDASGAVCLGADGTDPQGLSEAVGKFSDASGKLGYVVDPQDDREKDHILDLSAGACAQTSVLLGGVQALAGAGGAGGAAGAAGGARAQRLDAQGAAVADAAQALLAVAQVTAPSISHPHCKTSLLHPVDLLSQYSRELATTWQPYLQDPKHKQQATALQQALQALEQQIETLRKACVQSAPKKKPPPAAPHRTVSVTGNSSGKRTHDATKEFLDRLRCEEGQARSTADAPDSTCPRPAVMTDDEKRLLQLFLQSADDAEKTIKKTEEGLKQASKSQLVAPAISVGDCMAKQARLQRNIALAAVEVAALVGANYGHTMDYASAAQSTKELPRLISIIVEDGNLLSSTVSEEARRALREDLQHLCAAGRTICHSARDEREKLNDAAIEFGDKSTKLLYVVSNDVDPALEKEIISRAKAIGDGVVAISVSTGVMAAASPRRVDALCRAGARAQDGAGKLLYTAKLVAPSIYETPCQEALFKSAENLSTELRNFTSSWKPFSADPHHAKTVKELGKEAENLERILQGLKSDVKGGRIGQRREIEKLVVEDTPIRQLTCKIMEDAKKLSESSDLSPALKKEYVEYSKKLSDELRALDLANARCKRTPHDTNKRRELENTIQNLQMTLLQTRPTRGDKARSNIVDLRDFIDEVSLEASKLVEVTGTLKVPTAGDKKTLQNIAGNSEKISKAAYKLTHTDDAAGFDTSFDDILDVDQFGQECDAVIKDINAQLQSMEDAKVRTALLSKILPLTESCNMLRFATKSGISASKSVSLDSTLDDLDDIETRVIRSIVKDGENNTSVALRSGPVRGSEPGVGNKLVRAVCARAGASPRAPLTAYVAHVASTTDTTDDVNRNKLLKHLYKLVHLLKTQTVTASKRIATWQPLDDPEVATITEQILQEIQNPESKFQESGKTKRILDESELNRLLVSSSAKISGDAKHQEGQLTQLSAKLSSMCGALTLSIASPEALVRSAHAASDAAIELSSIARGCKNKKDPVQSERIEEAVQEMTFTTYGVLKTAELACLEPGNPNSKRRLLDACRSLNDSINKLVHTASSSSKLQKECGSMSRSLQLQLASIHSEPAATSALPYDQCCEAIDQQQEIVYKLKSDQPMTRQEFARSLTEVNEAVCRTTEITSQCAYLISVSEKDSDIAKKGPVDVPQIQKSIETLQDSCMSIIGSSSIHQAKEETDELHKRVQDFSRALDEAQLKVKEGGVKASLTRARAGVCTAAGTLWDSLKEGHDMEKVTPHAVSLLEEVNRAHSSVERCPLAPSARDLGADTRARCHELANNSKSLLSHTLALVQEVTAAEDEVMTWVTFNASKTRLLDAYDALVKSIRVNGQRAGILEGTPEDEVQDLDVEHKTYLEIQVDLANKWLNKPMCKNDIKKTGQDGVRNVIDIATKMSEDLKGSEREEIRSLVTECEELLTHCSARYDQDKYSTLVERLKELKKAVQRGVVTRVVEDFMEVDDPAAHLDVLVDAEEDEQKRKFLLERKIAELLAQLGRVTRTARFVAHAAGPKPAPELLACSEQTELLAPMLVQAAQERITTPNNQAAVDRYKELLAQYAASIAKVRDLCDRAVDPMDFVQTAGDTMQRMREESAANDDVQRGHRTSEAIIKLANRSIEVSMESRGVRRDPELRAALQAARARLLAVTPAERARASALPDWRERAAEVMRTTGDVECALGGEHIFNKQPTAEDSQHQIYNTARELHESVRGWSARDNDIVAAARRVAVLMARLAQHVQTENKQALISTSKSIVTESHEVAVLARKLAQECTDVRIKTNLLQTCERIPTISAQLKMLTTVKGSSLGHQGSKEDTEAMDMLVGNAQSLMLSIQEVVKAAASASVKIMSQRGPRLRWVRKTYY